MTALVRNAGLLLFSLCIVTTAAHGASQTIPVGGTGGSRFSIRCPERQVLVGFSMRSGKALDFIGPICARMKADGRTLRPTTVPAFTGGRGGSTSQSLACPFDSFVDTLNVFVDRWEIVHHIEILCRSLKNSAPFGNWHVPAFRGAAQRSHTVDCQTGHIPNGIHGNSGALIDRIGMLCDQTSRIVTP